MQWEKMWHTCDPFTAADYDRTVTLMNALLDLAGDDEDHPLSSLLELAAEMVSRYEQEHHAIEASNPKDSLRINQLS